MTEFPAKDYWKIYLDKPTKQRVREIQDHLDENYEGKTDFVQQMIKEETPESLEERIKQAEKEKERKKNKLERLKELRREQERDQKLDELEDKLRDKQDRLDEMLAGEFVSREEAEQQALELLSDRSGAWKDMSESEIRDTRAFETKVEKLVSTEEDVEELKKEVDRLQRRVAELNGGREDWFLELDSMEVTA